MRPWMQYVFAFIVLCHGLIYIAIGSVLPRPVKHWNGSSWLLGHAEPHGRLMDLIVELHVVAGLVIVTCAAAIVLAPLIPGWWRPLAFAGTAIGIAGFTIFWDGQTKWLVEEGVIGAAVSAVLLATVAAFPQLLD